jgi:hypothetical protein
VSNRNFAQATQFNRVDKELPSSVVHGRSPPPDIYISSISEMSVMRLPT